MLQHNLEEPTEMLAMVEQFLGQGATLKDLRGLEDQHMDAVYHMAHGLYAAGKFEKARQVFRFLLLYDHLEPSYALGMAACSQMLRDFKGALLAYSQAAFLAPDDPRASFHAAECMLSLKEKDGARQALEAALLLCGEDPQHELLRRRAQHLLQLMNQSKKERT